MVLSKEGNPKMFQSVKIFSPYIFFLCRYNIGNFVASRFFAGSSLMRYKSVLGGAKQIQVDPNRFWWGQIYSSKPNLFWVGPKRLKTQTILCRAKQTRLDPERFGWDQTASSRPKLSCQEGAGVRIPGWR